MQRNEWSKKLTRRQALGGLAAAGLAPVVGRLGLGARTAGAQSAPVVISIIDSAGDLSSVRDIVENYKKANPQKVKDVTYQRAPAPELPAKIKTQQDAGRVDINLVMTGQDAGFVMLEAGQLVKLFPEYDAMFPKSELTEAARVYQEDGQGFLMPSVVSNGGPVFIYNPQKVKTPPKTVDEFKAWIKANPGKFMYARPANSGPGRSVLSGMSYILGDKNPRDPMSGWDKSWAFLKEIGESIEYYPTGTAVTLKEFAEGTRWIIAGIMEWDMKPRAEGTIPPDSQIFILPNTSFVIDGHAWCIPKGVSKAEMDVILDLMKFMRRPEQQVLTWKGFIGPSIKAATVDKAPPDLQKLVRDHWRPEYTDMEKKYKVVAQLKPHDMVAAMDKWDKDVGAQRIKKT
jgi:putative spermidine/putrescine transport system substrate-binding protein